MPSACFPSLAHRVVNAWRETIPPCVTVPALPASEAAQRQFHACLVHVADSLSAHPDWLGMQELPDDGYAHGELNNRRPELIAAFLKLRRKLDDFHDLLLRMGLSGTATDDTLHIPRGAMSFPAPTRMRLAQFGLLCDAGKEETRVTCPLFPSLFPAWVWLAADARRTAPDTGRKGAPPLRFTHGLFSVTHPYSRDLFLHLAKDMPAVASLVTWLESNGYALVVDRDNKQTADWVKNYGRKLEPLKDAWGERTHGGLAMEYRWTCRQPLYFGLRVPEYRRLLARIDDMPESLRAFVVRQTKHCDGCGYCTQTDKTGTRPWALVSVDHHGRHALCPLFPGFSYGWQEIDAPLADDLRAFLVFADAVLAGND